MRSEPRNSAPDRYRQIAVIVVAGVSGEGRELGSFARTPFPQILDLARLAAFLLVGNLCICHPDSTFGHNAPSCRYDRSPDSTPISLLRKDFHYRNLPQPS
jgi:hypothetical protein